MLAIPMRPRIVCFLKDSGQGSTSILPANQNFIDYQQDKLNSIYKIPCLDSIMVGFSCLFLGIKLDQLAVIPQRHQAPQDIEAP
jgi:hypothetical protein